MQHIAILVMHVLQQIAILVNACFSQNEHATCQNSLLAGKVCTNFLRKTKQFQNNDLNNAFSFPRCL